MKENQITNKALAKSMNKFITSLDVQDQWNISEPINGKERPVGRTTITFVENLVPQQQINQQRERPRVMLSLRY
jgi:hypothetical protein